MSFVFFFTLSGAFLKLFPICLSFPHQILFCIYTWIIRSFCIIIDYYRFLHIYPRIIIHLYNHVIKKYIFNNNKINSWNSITIFKQYHKKPYTVFFNTIKCRYYSRLFLIVFEEVNRRKNPGEGVELEEMAKLASSSFPKLVCLMKEKLTKAVINKQTLEILEHFPEADIRLLEGMAIPLAFSRIVSYIKIHAAHCQYSFMAFS